MNGLELIRNKSGRLFIKSSIEIVNKLHEDIGIGSNSSQTVPFVFSPEQVTCYRPSSYDDTELLDKTCIELANSLEPYVIGCDFNTFDKLFLSL